jgi:acetyl-CoA C-acetyltransferase
MSNAPFYLINHRKGHSFGEQKILDAVALDGLIDSFHKISMGVCAEKTVSDFKMSKKVQDDFAITSYNRTF